MGHDKPIVHFFHGFWGRASDFQNFQSPVFTINSIEYTRDEFLSPQCPLSEWGGQFWKWVEKKGINWPLKAVGYSQGGRLLLQAFTKHPDRFEKMILISSHPGLKSEEDKRLRLLQDHEVAQHFRTWDWSILQSNWNAQGVFHGGKEIIRQEKDFDRETLALCLEKWSLGRQANFRSLIHQWPDKIQIILGDQDVKYLKLYEEFGCPFQKIKGAAHRAPFDQPQLCIEAIENFLLWHGPHG